MALKDKKQDLLDKKTVQTDKKIKKPRKRKAAESVPATMKETKPQKKIKVQDERKIKIDSSIPKGIPIVRTKIPNNKKIAQTDKKIEKPRKRNAAESVSETMKETKPPKKIKVQDEPKIKIDSSIPKGIPIVRTKIPSTYPHENIIQVSNLPKKYKQIDIIEAFNIYGHITYIQKINNKLLVAFLKKEEASNALRANNVTRIRDEIIKVKKRKEKCPRNATENGGCRVKIDYYNPLVTEDDIRNHFKGCGKIVSITMGKKNVFCCYVLFENEVFGEAALKLHNSILKDKNITVRMLGRKFVPSYPYRTIVLLNEDGLTKLEGSILMNIFEKFGEIELCDVTCKPKKLAVITFKDDKAALDALKLNGKHINGLKIFVELYANQLLKIAVPHQPNPFEEKLKQAEIKKRKVIVENIRKDIPRESLEVFFKSCGSIECITFLNQSAIVEFSDSNGYCKSFALDNKYFMGRRVSILPFSEKNPKELT